MPCIGRQILNHCATREALDGPLLTQESVSVIKDAPVFDMSPTPKPQFCVTTLAFHMIEFEVISDFSVISYFEISLRFSVSSPF